MKTLLKLQLYILSFKEQDKNKKNKTERYADHCRYDGINYICQIENDRNYTEDYICKKADQKFLRRKLQNFAYNHERDYTDDT